MSEKTEISAKTVEEAANFIKLKTNCNPKIGIMCSSELDILSDILGISRKVIISSSQIPHFPKSKSKKSYHLLFGDINKTPIVILKGKLHLYEGYSLQECTMIVYVLKALGVEYLLLANTAGSVNPKYNVGDVLIIKKHVYLMGFYDLNSTEPFNEKCGPRFANRQPLYDKRLINKSKDILRRELGFNDSARLGTYAFVVGPNYETVAEVKLLKACSVDAVGMCIVPEVLAAKRCGMTVFAFSLITNRCATDYDSKEETDHDDIMQISTERSVILKVFVEKLIEYLCTLIIQQ